ncbi:MAG TPA: AlpA family phage regulatory protein [Sphingomonas sp.]|nr:AlpA family phage regulatory protein [Sphingomonas sp.]
MNTKTPKVAPPPSRAADRIAKREVDYGLDDRLIPLAVVTEIAGIGKTMIYRLMREGTFPKSCKPGGASTRWSEREVREWRDRILAERDAA